MKPTEIRNLRQRLGLSQREFAIALGINADGSRVVAGACWCPITDHHGRPVTCHADVLLEIANAP